MKVTFLPAMKKVEIPEGSTVLEAIREVGLQVEAPCGGHGTCGKCKVQITKGNDQHYSIEEEKTLEKEELEKGIRLACRCQVEEDMCVILPKQRTSVNPIVPPKQEKETERKILENRRIGIAMDLGTTTIELQFFDLESNRLLIGERFMNPQRMYGADVISRITYCHHHPERVKMLQQMVIKACNEVIERLLTTIHLSIASVERMVVVCNTTMSHILAGESVDSLATAPFHMSYSGGTTFTPRELPFVMNDKGEIYILPNIGGHVGSDALGCAVSLGLEKKKGVYLLMDIGTNGEMILTKDGKMTACSTAAGPAFEGAGIAYGMCAQTGAITKVACKGSNSRPGKDAFRLHVIGNTIPLGISGSGVIDALACMLKTQVMDQTGYLPEQYQIQDEEGKAIGFPLYQDEEGRHVLLTREDIRQIQMAKAAIYAGAMTLLAVEGIELKELDGIFLAGAFGSHIDVENAMRIGLLPTVEREKVKEVGNAALHGAREVLFYEETRKKVGAYKIRHRELADTEVFKHKFIEAINF